MSELKRRKLDVNGVRLHYRQMGEGPAVVLLHGFPQTSYCWRKVMPELARDFTVIAPDYRGAGHSTRPAGGYDKVTMAADINGLVRALGFESATIVGHDMGLMVAYAYAATYRDETDKLAVIDALLPGTKVWDEVSINPRLWHLSFHAARDVGEYLTAGRERGYISLFFSAHSGDPSVFGEDEIDEYARAFSAPGGMRAAFEVYRAVPQDAEDNRRLMQRKLTIPVLAIGGELSASGPVLDKTMREVAENVTYRVAPGSGHFVPEEAPDFLAETLREFIKS